MSAEQDYFHLIVYAPTLVSGDKRPLPVIHGVERALPGLRLEWTTSEREDLIPVSNRDEWVIADTTDGGFPFLCNEDDDNLVTLTGIENPGGPCDQPQLEVFARLPLNAPATLAAVDVLAAVAEGRS